MVVGCTVLKKVQGAGAAASDLEKIKKSRRARQRQQNRPKASKISCLRRVPVCPKGLKIQEKPRCFPTAPQKEQKNSKIAQKGATEGEQVKIIIFGAILHILDARGHNSTKAT